MRQPIQRRVRDLYFVGTGDRQSAEPAVYRSEHAAMRNNQYGLALVLGRIVRQRIYNALAKLKAGLPT